MFNRMIKIPCMLFRGGTSKGPFFLKSDLPCNVQARNKTLLSLMGSPHLRQIDGIGGGDSLSSKAAIVSVSKREDADIDYLLCQVHINDEIVDTSLNCGNMLSAVAPYAIEKGLVKATHPETLVRIFNENTQVVMHVTVQTPNRVVTYEGDASIDGVSGTGAPIKISFLNAVGAKTGKLLPTGNVVDDIDGVTVSCVDVAVPMVIVAATSLNKSGNETKEELDGDLLFLNKLETLRKAAALKMGLGDVSKSISPKICLVSKSQNNGTINSRYFTPFDCHSAHAVSGALCLAAACLLEGSVANKYSTLPLSISGNNETEINIEHPTGKITTMLTTTRINNQINFPAASFVRTARPLFEGNVLLRKTVEMKLEQVNYLQLVK